MTQSSWVLGPGPRTFRRTLALFGCDSLFTEDIDYCIQMMRERTKAETAKFEVLVPGTLLQQHSITISFTFHIILSAIKILQSLLSNIERQEKKYNQNQTKTGATAATTALLNWVWV